MDTTSMLGLAFGILVVSLQLLSSISCTCRPIATSSFHHLINNHSSTLVEVQLNKLLHEADHDKRRTADDHHHRHGDAHINNYTSSVDVSMKTLDIDDEEDEDDLSTHDMMQVDTAVTRHPVVPALFAFGDSTVDAGNNNHLATVSRSNFSPYGRDLPEKRPTGRFCNGKLVTDYFAEKLGLEPRMIAYLDIQNNGKTRLGYLNMPLHLEVSFGSASSGFYDNTATHFNALSLRKQVAHFREYRQRLVQEIGEGDAKEVLGKAVFIISTGSNDYLNNYFVNPYLKSKYNLPQFQTFILGLCARLIKDIHGLGARRVGVVSLPPIGCLPAIRTFYGKGANHECVHHLNNYAMNFNQELQRNVLPQLQNNLSDLHVAYMDSYGVLLDIVTNSTKYGMKQARKACCGSGKLEVGIFCNKLSLGTCKDAGQYAFWDSFHPTDRTNEILATRLLEQFWKVFNLDHDRYVYLYQPRSSPVDPTSTIHVRHSDEENVATILDMEQWRCRIFLLGGVLYIVHLVKQFFPKIIDMGI
ncbi:hypothetical protein L7F22_004413 [Adiantum nelumboides]|nr:hypothetical protein [Adiantum nelumboides]